MQDTDEIFFQEFVLNLRWLCYYATHCLSRSTEARYPSILDDVAALFDVLPASATHVHSLASLPLAALQVATDGALYLLVAEALLGSCPPTMHTFLDHMEDRKRHGTASPETTASARSGLNSSASRASGSVDGGGGSSSVDTHTIGSLNADELNRSLSSTRSATCSQSQAMLLLHKWLVAEGILAAEALAATLQLATDGADSAGSVSASVTPNRDPIRERRRQDARTATQLAQMTPFFLGAHVLLSRSLLIWHCANVTTGEDVHAHARSLAGDAWSLIRNQPPWHAPINSGSTVEQDILLWIDCTLTCLERTVQQKQLEHKSGRDSSVLSPTPSRQSPKPSRRHGPRTTAVASPMVNETVDYFRLRRQRGTRRYASVASLLTSLCDGADLCFVLHFYEPQLLPLASVQIVSHADDGEGRVEGRDNAEAQRSGQSREEMARATWNWNCALRVLRNLGLWPGITADEAVHLGESVLPLHVLRLVEEMFVLLATRAEETLRDSVDLEHERSVLSAQAVPNSLSASNIAVEAYTGSLPSGPTVLPPFVSRSGVTHGVAQSAHPENSPHVVMHSVSQPFPRTATKSESSPPRTDFGAAREQTEEPQQRPSSRPSTTSTTDRLLSPSMPAWDVGYGSAEETQVRAPIRPLVKKRRSPSDHKHHKNSSTTNIPPTTHARSRPDAEARLPWLDVADPVILASREASLVVTARSSTGGLVQSPNSSISSVYAVSDDLTDDVGRVTATSTVTSSAVARSQPFTVTRTFSKPSEVSVPVPPAVALQSSFSASASARSLFAAASTPMPDGSPPFGIYSTPKRVQRVSRSPSDHSPAHSCDDDESFDVVRISNTEQRSTPEGGSPPMVVAEDDDTAARRSTADERHRFGGNDEPMPVTADNVPRAVEASEEEEEDAASGSSATLAPRDKTASLEINSTPPVSEEVGLAAPPAQRQQSPIEPPPSNPARALGKTEPVSSSNFFSSPTAPCRRTLDPLSNHDTGVPASQLSRVTCRSHSGMELVQFNSIASRLNDAGTDGSGDGGGDQSADEPSATIDIDTPASSSREAPDAHLPSDGMSVSTARVDSVRTDADEPTRHTDPQPVPSTVPSASTSSTAPLEPHVSRSVSSCDSSEESEFVVRKISVPQQAHTEGPAVGAPRAETASEVGSPSPLGTPARQARSSRGEHTNDIDDYAPLSAQTPEVLSTIGVCDPRQRSLFMDESTVYGSHEPSGVNDSWFSSVSRPGHRRMVSSSSPPRGHVPDHATLLETVAEQQRIIEHLTNLLQRGPRPTSASSRGVSMSQWTDRTSLGAQTVERAGRASSMATGLSEQLTASDITDALQRRFEEEADEGESSSVQ